MAHDSVQPIRVLSGAQLTRVRSIYEEAFSPDLRVPFEELTMEGDVDRTRVALDGQTAAGLAALRLLRSVEWTFLRYFAIDASRRSQGAGRQFWRLLREALAADGWPLRIVFEVEVPEEAATVAERSVRQRRIRFWTDCGARLLPVPGYTLPDYTGSGMTEPMLLMAADADAAQDIEGEELRSLVLAIYTDRYGVPVTDPLVARALASLPGPPASA